jgi:hypothetical protein
LRFDWKTELEDHCWHDHPEFRHDYPAQAVPRRVDEPPPVVATAPAGPRRGGERLVRWLLPGEARGRPHIPHPPADTKPPADDPT